MSYLVLARKYRPRSFDEVAGQPAVARTLENAIRLGRIAHAYLFAGPRGVGKTSLARILAASLCCRTGETTTPCGTCERCVAIRRGNDLDVVEIDAASNRGIDDIRALREKARVAPMLGARKVYIVDEAHQLTSEAFNALLKTLEEPPEHVVFVLATTEAERLPDTIRSRCQSFEFRRVSAGEIAARLRAICDQEKVQAEDAALRAIARSSRGGMRDAQSLLDQVITHGGGSVTAAGVVEVTGSLSPDAVAALLEAAVRSDLPALLAEVDRLDRAGVAAEGVLDALLGEARDLLVLCSGGDESLLGRGDGAEVLRPLAAGLDVDRVLAIVNVLLGARRRMREHDEPRLVLEASLLRIARLSSAPSLADALAILRAAPAAGPAPGVVRPRTDARPVAPPRAESAAQRPTVKAPESVGGDLAADPALARPLPEDPAEVLAALREELARTNGAIAAMLGGFAPMAVRGDVLEVAAAAGATALYSLGEPRVRKAIDEAARKRFGRALILRQVADTDGGSGAAGRSAPASPPVPSAPDATAPPSSRGGPGAKNAKGSKLLDAAREMFDGEVMDG